MVAGTTWLVVLLQVHICHGTLLMKYNASASESVVVGTTNGVEQWLDLSGNSRTLDVWNPRPSYDQTRRCVWFTGAASMRVAVADMPAKPLHMIIDVELEALAMGSRNSRWYLLDGVNVDSMALYYEQGKLFQYGKGSANRNQIDTKDATAWPDERQTVELIFDGSSSKMAVLGQPWSGNQITSPSPGGLTIGDYGTGKVGNAAFCLHRLEIWEGLPTEEDRLVRGVATSTATTTTATTSTSQLVFVSACIQSVLSRTIFVVGVFMLFFGPGST